MESVSSIGTEASIPQNFESKNSISSKYVILESKEGHQFYIKEEYVMKAGTIKSMLEGQGPFIETKSRTIRFEEISTNILEKVCEYLLYKHHYSTRSNELIPEFPIPPEYAVDLILVANFLDC